MMRTHGTDRIGAEQSGDPPSPVVGQEPELHPPDSVHEPYGAGLGSRGNERDRPVLRLDERIDQRQRGLLGADVEPHAVLGAPGISSQHHPTGLAYGGGVTPPSMPTTSGNGPGAQPQCAVEGWPAAPADPRAMRP